MSLFDKFLDPEPADENQPAEPWQDEGDGLSPTPADFPVLDPLPMRPNVRTLIEYMREHVTCTKHPCVMDDRKRLAEECGALFVEGIATVQAAAATLYAHGETLAAEAILEGLAVVAEDVIRPFLESAGLSTDIAGDSE